MDKLLEQFSPAFREALVPYEKEMQRAREIRIRVQQPLLLCGRSSFAVPGFLPGAEDMERLLLAFCDQALYACEEQLRQGYLTLRGGHRAGVCGHILAENGRAVRLHGIQGISLRIARQMPCDSRVMNVIAPSGRLRSVLVVSPPGGGKTTLLREAARQLSVRGIQVALADERGELAACVEGVPQLDVGPCTDVMDNLPKAEAIGMMLRAMSPQVLVSDEIGNAQDAEALLDVQRCGVKVLCSAHGASYAEVQARSCVRQLLRESVFDRVLLLGREPGRIAAVYDREGRPCSD